MALGDNGIFKKAQESKSTMEKAVLKEKIETIKLGWEADRIVDSSIGVDRLWKDLKEADIIDSVETDVKKQGEETLEEGGTKTTYEIDTKEGYDVIIIVITDPEGNIKVEIDEIINNEKALPKVSIKLSDPTTSGVTVKVEARRAEGKLVYLYKLEEETQYTKYAETEETQITITGLQANKIYKIKVEASNKNGTASSNEETIRTIELEQGIIQLEQTTWNNGLASIKISSTSSYTLQYQVEGIEENGWNNYTEEGITGLSHGQTVYARIYDGTNATQPVGIPVQDGIEPEEATITANSGYEITSGTTVSISATVTHTDNESGVDIANCKYVFNNDATKLGTESSSYTDGTFSSNGEKISKTVSEGTYYLHVLTIDKAGNKTETVKGPITVVQKVTGISISQTSASIAEGSTLQLTATISPENATNKEVEWISSNESVATVDTNGLVTAIAEGSATITANAKDGSNVKTECNITVTMNPANYTWSQNKTIVTGVHKTISGKTVTLTVGTNYAYNAGVSNGYTGTWKVLGAGEGSEAGKLLIMTASDVTTLGLKGKTGDGTSSYPAGYNNGIAKLNEVCSEKCGTGARSVNVDDINRVTGYDPENQGDGTVYGAGGWNEYGNVVTYTPTGATASNGNTSTDGLYNSVYYHPDGRTIAGTEGTQVGSITETNTAYFYYPYSLTGDSAITGTCKGISTSSAAYEMIFGTYANASSGKGNAYWLASSCVVTDSVQTRFLMRYVHSYGGVNSFGMWYSSSTALYGTSRAVRAVVSL